MGEQKMKCKVFVAERGAIQKRETNAREVA
jgi:hypothetical protein